MTHRATNRREFLKTTSSITAAAVVAPYYFTGAKGVADDAKAASKNDRPIVGCIGTGDRWNAVGPAAMRFGDVAAVCDVDREHAEKGQKKVKDVQQRDADVYEDYHKILDRKDIEVVTIVTPDHWHSKIAIDAMQAGKDVYCEKPLTLTIDEGKQIAKVLRQTGRVFQVGTQQRSEMELRFLKAVALVKDGRLGAIKKVQCAIGDVEASGPIPKADVPSQLNWELWQGQAPLADYRYKPDTSPKPKHKYGLSRCHYEFRWWYEYSGGKMTDWGAHHVDIAQWAIGMDHSGPISIQGTAKHPVELKNGMPTDDSQFNVATKFNVVCKFANGVEIVIRDDTENGITIEGEKSTLFVSRSALRGPAVDELAAMPLAEGALKKLYKGREPGNHMRNFFECVKTREQPISDVYTHHRAMTTCHLANIAIRLDRPIKWDPENEQIVGDADANRWQRREQRKGYEIHV